MPSHVIDSAFFRDHFGTARMRAVWDDRALLQCWLDYEAALAKAEAAEGMIPHDAANEIGKKARATLFDLDELKDGIDRTVHPLVPVVWKLAALCEGEAGRYVHWGATTQDVMDTALAMQLRDAQAILDGALAEVIDALAALSTRFRATPMAGRTHGQQALPITFGFKTATWLAELLRHQARLAEGRDRLFVGQFGGAVGTLAGIADGGQEEQAQQVQTRLMAELGLGVPVIAWHSSRDSFAAFATTLCGVCATLGKIAHEIINLQMTELAEVEEGQEAGKVGSSTMPQKRNPMLCETILTLSRLTRGHAVTAMDAMLHDFERDWSSFQMEWEYLPELCLMTDAALSMTGRVLAGLTVRPDRMRRNLEITGGLLLAERVMFALAASLGRQDAHDLVHAVARRAQEQDQPFGTLLRTEPAVAAVLSPDQIARLLNPESYLGLAAHYADSVVQQAREGQRRVQALDSIEEGRE